MVRFNLLPWRDLQRDYQHKKIKQLFAIVIIIASMSVIVLHFHYQHSISIHAQHVLSLSNEWEEISSRDKRMPAIPAIKTLQPFVAYRDATKNLFIKLGASAENNICFTEMIRQANSITFSGRIHSVAELANDLAHWQAAQLFSEIKIQQLQRLDDQSYTFKLQAFEVQPRPEIFHLN